MDLLTKQQFENSMQQVFDWLRKHDELLLSMNTVKRQKTELSDKIRLFDNQDLCFLLQVSKRTLQRYRSMGVLPYKMLGQKTYYSETDVIDFLSRNIKDFKQDDVAFYKARIHNFFNK